MELSDNQYNRYEKIERFLNGELSADELQSFRDEMKADRDLATEVEWVRGVNFCIANQDKKELKDDLVHTRGLISDIRGRVEVNYEGAEISGETTPGVIKWLTEAFDATVALLNPPQLAFRMVTYAFVFLIIGVPTYLLFLNQPTGSELYTDYYTPYEHVLSTRGSSDEGLNKAMLLYESKDFKGANAQFDSLLAATPGFYELNFYRGITHIELENYDSAIRDLEAVLDQNSTLSNQAEWYLALIYLKENNVLESKKLLKNIAKNNKLYSSKAEAILKKID